jgi:DNA-binding transcriptional LysR family regulator
MKLNLHLLRLFYTVVQQGSFSAAAQSLFISQPGISKAIRELENQLNLPLIERGARGRAMRLTESGQVLFEHARSIFALEKAALNEIHARNGLKKGTLIIGASTTIAAYWLGPLLARFLKEFPQINIEVQVANTHVISQALIDCAIDMALVEGSVQDARIDVKHWQQDQLSLVTAPSNQPSHITNLAQWLEKQLWLMRESGSGTREISMLLFEQQGLHPAGRMELGSNEAIARAVAAGIGIALLPQVVVEDLLTLGKLVSIPLADNQYLSRQLSFIQYRDRPLSPAAQAFCARIHQHTQSIKPFL